LASRVSINADDMFVSFNGGYGMDVISDTTAHTGTWRMMEVIADIVLTKFECTNIFVNDGTTTMDKATYPANLLKAGSKIYGNITDVTLTSGSVMLYRG
jgi:hypothetical protein